MSKNKTIKIIFSCFLIGIILCLSSNSHAQKKELKVGFIANNKPFQYLNTKAKGFHIDLMKEFEARTPYELSFLAFENKDELFNALEKDKIDMVLGLQSGEKDLQKLKVSNSISESRLSLIVKKKNAFFKNNVLKKGILSYERTTFPYSLNTFFDTYSALIARSQKDAFEYLMNNKADYMIGVYHVINSLIKKHAIKDEIVFIERFTLSIDFVAAVNIKNTSVIQLLNKTIEKLRVDGTYKKLRDKWLITEEKTIERNLLYLAYIGIIVVVILLLAFVYNYRVNFVLKNEVEKKTADLSEANYKLAEKLKEIKRVENMKNSIIYNSPYSIMVFDDKLKLSDINQSASEVLRVEMGEFSNIFNHYVIDEIFKDAKINKKTRLSNLSKKGETIHIESPDGEEKIIKYNIYPLSLEKKFAGLILSFDNITTEIEEKEEKLEQEKYEILSMMIKGIGLEMQNPINKISTFIAMLPLKIDDPAYRAQLTDIVPKETRNLNNLVTNLISFSKTREENLKEIDLRGATSAVLLTLSSMIYDEEVEVEFEKGETLKILANPEVIEQVINNILINSVENLRKKTTANKKVTITIYSEDKWAMLEIKDNSGIGSFQDLELNEDNGKNAEKMLSSTGLYLSKIYTEKQGGTFEIRTDENDHTSVVLKYEKI